MYVTGIPKLLVRLEGIVVVLLGLHFFNELDGSWLTFALLFLVPDVSFAGYLIGAGTGAIAYNVAHTYVSPAALAALGYTLDNPALYPIALIWIVHIGFDRALGLGLKYAVGFRLTHLGRIGKGDDDVSEPESM